MRNYTYVSSSLYNTIRNFNNINLFLKLFKIWFVWELHVNVFIQVIVELWLLPNKFWPSSKNHLTTKPSYFLCYFNSRWTVDSFNMRAWDDSLRTIQVFYFLGMFYLCDLKWTHVLTQQLLTRLILLINQKLWYVFTCTVKLAL